LVERQDLRAGLYPMDVGACKFLGVQKIFAEIFTNLPKKVP